MKDYEYRDNNGNPIDYYTVVNDATMMLRELNEKDKQIDQLTNNWNELKQHIKDYLEEWENSDNEWVKGKCDMASDILYDMKEIKENNK